MTIRIGGFFSGIGAHHSAADRLGIDYEMVFQCEFDPPTANAYNTIHGETRNLGDITQVHDIGGENRVDVLFWTPPCIRKGDLVLTSQGYIPIEEVTEGEGVLSHDGQWHPVEWAGKTGYREIIEVQTAYHNRGVGATPEHKFYACRCNENGEFTEPEWVMAKDLTLAHYLGHPDVWNYSLTWLPIKKLIRKRKKCDVYDLTVKDSHSFVVNGVVVHNCQDISAAGRGAGNTKGSGTRSSLAFEVPRIIANTGERERDLNIS